MPIDTPSPEAEGRGGRLPDEMIPLAEVNERVAAAIRATLDGAKLIGQQEIETAIVRTHKGLAETVRMLVPRLRDLSATEALHAVANAIEGAAAGREALSRQKAE